MWLVMIPLRNCYLRTSLITSPRFILLTMMNNNGYENMYQGKTVVQLKELLRQRGLPVSGLKQDLISRLSIPPIRTNVSTSSTSNPIPTAPSTMTTTQTTTPFSPAVTPMTPPTTKSSSTAKSYLLQFDGGSRGNPGHAGSGSVILDGETGREVWNSYTYVGPSYTNNVAEYRGLIEGLRQVRSR